MEHVIFAVSAALFLSSLLLVFLCRRTLVRYTKQLSDCLDDMIAGKDEILFQEEQETLIGKLHAKLRRLYEILQVRARQSQTEREKLEGVIADLSHQVKTPIASVRMYHNFLQKEMLEESRRNEFLGALERQVDKLEFLIQSMIKISRIETGIVKVHPEYSSVYTLIENVVCDAALKAETKMIDITVDCEEKKKAYFDPKWTREALFNLVDNAIKYTGSGGTIQISAMTTDFFVRIRVKDRGRGINEAHLPQIFKRFYREPEAAQSEGVGIGLFLAREIVDRQKGFIEVQSVLGEGSVFSIHLPLEKT